MQGCACLPRTACTYSILENKKSALVVFFKYIFSISLKMKIINKIFFLLNLVEVMLTLNMYCSVVA